MQGICKDFGTIVGQLFVANNGKILWQEAGLEGDLPEMLKACHALNQDLVDTALIHLPCICCCIRLRYG